MGICVSTEYERGVSLQVLRSSERTPCLLKGFGMKRKRLSGESGTPYFSIIITLSGLEKRRVSYPY